MTKKFSLLKQIQPYVIKYANVIAEVLNVDIEIVDKNLMRVAGTGIYQATIDEICEGLSYKSVLIEKVHKIILEPAKEECCKGCLLKDNCNEELEIATPIFYKENIIGVIGLVCSNREQKKKILKNIDENIKFLENISELISSKVYEEFSTKGVGDSTYSIIEIIKNVDNPVVIIDEDDKICELNNSALKELNLKLLSRNIYNDTKDIASGSYRLIDFNLDNINNFTTKVPINIGTYKEAIIFKGNKENNIGLIDNNEGKKVAVEKIIGQSESILEMKKNIKKISQSTSTVLITGESGTGKELVARAIHEEGNRKDKPFIAINCAAIPENLLESELFGYAKGAFSGANTQGRMGKFELANNGVIFLDEIGDMPLNLQAKILRVLQDRKCVRIGSNKLINLDIRIVAATNKDLRRLTEEGKFRADLFYRLNVISIKIPPLRERGDDIKTIMDSFIQKYNKNLNKPTTDIEKSVLKAIQSYSWPGNIRELENCIEYMINLAEDDGIIKFSFLPDEIKNCRRELSEEVSYENEPTLSELESRYIKYMMDKYGDSLKAKKEISKRLGIGIATLYRKLDYK